MTPSNGVWGGCGGSGAKTVVVSGGGGDKLAGSETTATWLPAAAAAAAGRKRTALGRLTCRAASLRGRLSVRVPLSHVLPP